ncbi:response regulator transcription factor [Arthrobacter sp. MW3 TE3886]|uniref:helix-turn-helix transcriptional regulator n=1 Tax=Arthrobacter sp. MW3 TE3886 TaxID=3156254 RepID=UPI0035175D1F
MLLDWGGALPYKREMQHRRTSRLQFAVKLSRARSIEDLVQSLYSGIDEVFDSVVVGFDLLDPDTHRLLSTSAHGVSEFFLARYDSVGRASDPVLNHAIFSRDIAYNLAMMSEVEWRQLPVYREAFSLHRMTNLVYVPVVVAGKVVATLNLGRAGSPRFSTTELQDAKEIAALLSSLIESLQRQESLKHEIEIFRDAFDLGNEAVVISDVRRATRYVNRAAQRVLEGQHGDAPSFDQAVIKFQNREHRQVSDDGLVRRVVPLQSGEGIVAFLRTGSRAEGPPEWLRQSLTSRETEVMMLASKGLRDSEIAQHLNLSVHTIKGHLREIFKKTGARSRVELVRMAVAADVE